MCGDETANLGHNGHQSEAADVRAFSAHVGSRDDLEAGLLRSICIVWDEFGSLNLLADRMPAGLYGEGISKLRPGVVVSGDKVRERREHVQRGYAFADMEKGGNLTADIVDKGLNAGVGHVDYFVVSIADTLVVLDEV